MCPAPWPPRDTSTVVAAPPCCLRRSLNHAKFDRPFSCRCVRSARGYKFTFQDVAQMQLVLRAIEVFAVAVKRIVCQMHVWIVITLEGSYFDLPASRGHPHKKMHRRNDRRNQYIDPEIVFVPGVQGGLLDVLLNDIGFLAAQRRCIMLSTWPCVFDSSAALPCRYLVRS